MSGAANSDTAAPAPGMGNPESLESRGNEVTALLNLLVESAEAGVDIGRLGLLEVRLALSSLRRMLVIALLLLPLVLLAWIAVSLLPAVLWYQYSGSLLFALFGFIALQLLAVGTLVWLWGRYRKALGLPRTRHHVNAFLSGTHGEASVSGV